MWACFTAGLYITVFNDQMRCVPLLQTRTTTQRAIKADSSTAEVLMKTKPQQHSELSPN